jgi:hypothetical protein
VDLMVVKWWVQLVQGAAGPLKYLPWVPGYLGGSAGGGAVVRGWPAGFGLMGPLGVCGRARRGCGLPSSGVQKLVCLPPGLSDLSGLGVVLWRAAEWELVLQVRRELSKSLRLLLQVPSR